MKGKTGKPAMRGGGLARKGMGAALKGGGMARKGTGSNAMPGGKTPRMAVGGTPPVEAGRGMGMRPATPPGMANRPEGRPMPPGLANRPATPPGLANRPAPGTKTLRTGRGPDRAPGTKTLRTMGRGRLGTTPTATTTPAATTPTVAPVATPAVQPVSSYKKGGKVKKMAFGGPSTAPGTPPSTMGARPSAGTGTVSGPQNTMPRGLQGRPLPPGPAGRTPTAGLGSTGLGSTGLGSIGTPIIGTPIIGQPINQSPIMYYKKGGKVKAYAKGGAVKMTAGAGSGSGRLEKVAAHKSSPRVKAVGLKKGGKVRGK